MVCVSSAETKTKKNCGPVGTISLTKSPHAPQDESPFRVWWLNHSPCQRFFWGGINSTWLGPSTNWLCCPSRKDFEPLRWSLRWPMRLISHPSKFGGTRGVPYFQANLSGPFVKFLEITLEICEKSVRLVVFGIHETSNYEKQMVCFYHTFPSESMTQPSLSCTSPVWPSQNWIDSIDSSTQTTQGMDLWDAFLVAHFFTIFIHV